MRRAIVIVLDGCGAGAAPDAAEFGDPHEPNTLEHLWQKAGPVDAPHMLAAGFFGPSRQRSTQLPGDIRAGKREFSYRYARLKPLSKGGKDSVTGHWEMMGIVLDKPFPTYPNGFPIPLVKEFERRIGTQTIGNRAASGTQIIAELGGLHVDTGFPILYTSADSVFQIACHEDVVSVELLYEWCEIGRGLCVPPNGVQRVIARPFVGTAKEGFTRTERRRDYPASPPRNLIDEIGDVRGIGVVPELFGGRGFLPGPRTQSNEHHAVALVNALEDRTSRFIFANFEDTDMLYGHRNDPDGFARCLERFDKTWSELLSYMGRDDVVILTADHGNDPTDISTDHTREFVPCCIVTLGSGGFEDFGDVDGFASVGATVAKWLGVPWRAPQHWSSQTEWALPRSRRSLRCRSSGGRCG